MKQRKLFRKLPINSTNCHQRQQDTSHQEKSIKILANSKKNIEKCQQSRLFVFHFPYIFSPYLWRKSSNTVFPVSLSTYISKKHRKIDSNFVCKIFGKFFFKLQNLFFCSFFIPVLEKSMGKKLIQCMEKRNCFSTVT